MVIPQLIEHKRDGRALSPDEWRRLIRAFFPMVSDARPTAAARAKCPSARLESAATARRARISARA